MKAELFSLKQQQNISYDQVPLLESRQTTQTIFSTVQREISTLKQDFRTEVCDINRKIDCLSTGIPVQSCKPTSSSTIHPLKITSWNCRGVCNAQPYLEQLKNNGHDIIMIAEHWLWPYELARLDSVLEGYQGTGVCDHRLTEDATYPRGFGGVAIL